MSEKIRVVEGQVKRACIVILRVVIGYSLTPTQGRYGNGSVRMVSDHRWSGACPGPQKGEL